MTWDWHAAVRLGLVDPNHVNELGFANQQEMKIWRTGIQWRPSEDRFLASSRQG